MHCLRKNTIYILNMSEYFCAPKHTLRTISTSVRISLIKLDHDFCCVVNFRFINYNFCELEFSLPCDTWPFE